MSFKDPGLADRLASATRAKTATLEKFRAKPWAEDPAVLKRQAERAAIQAARPAPPSARLLVSRPRTLSGSPILSAKGGTGPRRPLAKNARRSRQPNRPSERSPLRPSARLLAMRAM